MKTQNRIPSTYIDVSSDICTFRKNCRILNRENDKKQNRITKLSNNHRKQ